MSNPAREVQKMLGDIPEEHEGAITCYLQEINTTTTTSILYPSLTYFAAMQAEVEKKGVAPASFTNDAETWLNAI